MGETWNIPVEWNRLTENIIGGAIEVHRTLGPGLLEKVYERALVHELTLRGLRVERQCSVRGTYKGIELPEQTLDICVDKLVVVELKAVKGVEDWMIAQMLSQMRFGNIPLGLVMNFHAPILKNAVFRRVNARALPQQAKSQSSGSVTESSDALLSDALTSSTTPSVFSESSVPTP